jgi:hypothetical protein
MLPWDPFSPQVVAKDEDDTRRSSTTPMMSLGGIAGAVIGSE